MKISVFETVEVDVETEVEIGIDEVLSEFASRVDAADEQDGMASRRLLEAIDRMTRILAAVRPGAISVLSDKSRETITRRLLAEAARFAPSPPAKLREFLGDQS